LPDSRDNHIAQEKPLQWDAHGAHDLVGNPISLPMSLAFSKRCGLNIFYGNASCPVVVARELYR